MANSAHAPQVLAFDIFGTVVDWHGSIAREIRAAHPAVDADAPYGPGTLDDAMVRALGGPRDDLARLHRAMQPALQIFLRSADIAPGDYA